MRQDLFKHLPSEIITDILSRLPIRSIVRSKCVCKPWLHLLETSAFVSFHLARSVPDVAVLLGDPNRNWYSCGYRYGIFESENGLDLDFEQYRLATKFKSYVELVGSANGLLLLHGDTIIEAHFIVNPSTREYIDLRFPKEFIYTYPTESTSHDMRTPVVNYGFGASKISGQLKVVRVFYESDEVGGLRRATSKYECYVYTLGTGSWRVVETGDPFMYIVDSFGALSNGTLHWVVFEMIDFAASISCFDLETELFSTFSPPVPLLNWSGFYVGLSDLGGCLSLCDRTRKEEVVIWVMEEYGDEKSWKKIYTIAIDRVFSDQVCFERVYALKVNEDGDVLMLWEDLFLLYYSSKTKKIGVVKSGDVMAILITPSLLSLKTFPMVKCQMYEGWSIIPEPYSYPTRRING